MPDSKDPKELSEKDRKMMGINMDGDPYAKLEDLSEEYKTGLLKDAEGLFSEGEYLSAAARFKFLDKPEEAKQAYRRLIETKVEGYESGKLTAFKPDAYSSKPNPRFLAFCKDWFIAGGIDWDDELVSRFTKVMHIDREELMNAEK